MANQAIRQEINMYDSLVAGETGSSGTVTKTAICQLDTTQYSGTPTYFFEVFGSGNASNTGTFKLRRKGTTTDDASVGPATNTSNILFRSSSFTPPAGQTEYVLAWVGDGTRTQSANTGRIIVLQSESQITKTETQIEIGAQQTAGTNTTVADMTNPKFWKYTAANWDGTKTFFVEVVWATASSNTVTITLCRTSDNASNKTIVSAGTGATRTRTRVSFTPVDGETYKIRAVGSTTKSNYFIDCAKIIVDQSNFTKCEPQFLILNCGDPNAVQPIAIGQTSWNSSEWDAGNGTITYLHAMDSDNASNSAALWDTTAAADVSSSTVTGSGQQVSTGITLINFRQYAADIKNTTGIIAGTRMLVDYVYVAPPIPDLIQQPLVALP